MQEVPNAIPKHLSTVDSFSRRCRSSHPKTVSSSEKHKTRRVLRDLQGSVIMSVILTACRNSTRKALERARKRKAERRRRLKEAEVAGLVNTIGPLPPQTATTRVWTFMLEDQPYGVIFNTDSLDVTLNGIRIECRADFTDDGSVTDFVVADHKARITTTSSGSRREGMVHCLSVDGYPIPE